MNFKIAFLLLSFFFGSNGKFVDKRPLPVVLWHGMGDSCCNPLSMGSIKKFIQQQLTGVYVLSIEIGNSVISDTYNGFFKPINEQINEACTIIKKDINLSDGFNAMGFSQGGQFLRALVQQCDGIKMNNLISFGGQHQGVFGFPRCPGQSAFLCEEARKLLNLGAYESYVQNHLVQAQYWHDPRNETQYKSKCVWLPKVNNINQINQQYKERLIKLNKFVMVMFNNDTMVQPKESEWFGFYVPGQDKKVHKLQETELYKQDLLGLKVMDRDKKLVFLATDGDHLQLSDSWMMKNIIPFLK